MISGICDVCDFRDIRSGKDGATSNIRLIDRKIIGERA